MAVPAFLFPPDAGGYTQSWPDHVRPGISTQVIEIKRLIYALASARNVARDMQLQCAMAYNRATHAVNLTSPANPVSCLP
ncbi:MAG TPA: hypothetical protein VMF64_16970 [Steroidobacteraceae bacterium]|nr:hypothetical protein [Steroidobacteraceae bacterium]